MLSKQDIISVEGNDTVKQARYRHKRQAKCDVNADIVGNWRFVVGKVEFALSVVIPYLNDAF